MKQTIFPLSDKEGVIIAEIPKDSCRFEVINEPIVSYKDRNEFYKLPLNPICEFEIIGTYPLTEEQAKKVVGFGFDHSKGEVYYADYSPRGVCLETAIESFSSLLKAEGVMLERHEVPFCWPEKTNKEIEESINKWKEAEEQRWCKNGEKLLIIKYKKA